MSQNQPQEGQQSQQKTQAQAGSIKKGGYCILRGYPCKVTQYTISKPKSGASKATITGQDIFTSKKYQQSFPTAATVSIPVVRTKQYQVADVDEDDRFAMLLLEEGDLKSVKLSVEEEDMYGRLREAFGVAGREDGTCVCVLLTACGMEKIVEVRVVRDGEGKGEVGGMVMVEQKQGEKQKYEGQNEAKKQQQTTQPKNSQQQNSQTVKNQPPNETPNTLTQNHLILAQHEQKSQHAQPTINQTN